MKFRSALLVEDESHLAQAIRIALKRLGIEVRRASTLTEARGALESFSPELIVLDRALPDGDGVSLCEELRARGSRVPILMLTARGETRDRVRGLMAGADDYLPKPFAWEELEARVIALARRAVAPSESSPSVSSEEGLWNREETRLRIRGPRGWVELTPLEFKLASHLIDSAGAIVSRSDLLKKVWGFTFLPKTRTVDHFMGRIRKHFERNPEEPEHFLTVRGAGYRFERGVSASGA